MLVVSVTVTDFIVTYLNPLPNSLEAIPISFSYYVNQMNSTSDCERNVNIWWILEYDLRSNTDWIVICTSTYNIILIRSLSASFSIVWEPPHLSQEILSKYIFFGLYSPHWTIDHIVLPILMANSSSRMIQVYCLKVVRRNWLRYRQCICSIQCITHSY